MGAFLIVGKVGIEPTHGRPIYSSNARRFKNSLCQ